MNSLAVPNLGAKSLTNELFHRQPILAGYGVAVLVLAIPVLAMTWLDPRLLENGHSPWVKPVKFLVSTGLFAVTAAWFFGYVRPERRDSRAMRWTSGALIASASFELFWITWQAGNGVDSHFNTGTPLNAVMFGLMGLFALILTGNAFAAFPIMASAIAVPLLLNEHGGDPAVVGAIGMLAGFCGTLMTPMAANFNLVPVTLLELKDPNAVIKAQIPTALPMLAINILFIWWFAF